MMAIATFLQEYPTQPVITLLRNMSSECGDTLLLQSSIIYFSKNNILCISYGYLFFWRKYIETAIKKDHLAIHFLPTSVV